MVKLIIHLFSKFQVVGSGICSCIEIRVDRVIVLAQCAGSIRFPSHCCFNAPAQLAI